MTNKSITGEYMHKYSSTVLHYVCEYHFTSLGVVYEAKAGFGDGKTARIANGVIVWGLGAIPPKRAVERVIRETIDIIDIQKLKKAVLEQSA